MSHKVAIDDSAGSPLDQIAAAPPLQPAPMQSPPVAPPPSAQPAQAFDPQRSRLLKRPFETAKAGAPLAPRPPLPTPGRPVSTPPRPR
jgi:hypothetical protein